MAAATALLSCGAHARLPPAQFEALGAAISIRTSTLVGGIDIMAQAISLAKRPHVIVGTPGRVTDHLTNTKARRSELPGGVHTGCLLGACG